jgi:DNA-binding transcriptional MerR regulator
MKRRTIGQLANELGIGVETIRFYQRRGLLPQPERVDGGYRHYDDQIASTIRYIRLARELGLSLRDIERVGEQLDGGPAFCATLRETARERLDAVNRQIAEFERLKAGLTAFLERCAARDQSTPCPVLVELGRLESAVHTTST